MSQTLAKIMIRTFQLLLNSDLLAWWLLKIDLRLEHLLLKSYLGLAMAVNN